MKTWSEIEQITARCDRARAEQRRREENRMALIVAVAGSVLAYFVWWAIR